MERGIRDPVPKLAEPQPHSQKLQCRPHAQTPSGSSDRMPPTPGSSAEPGTAPDQGSQSLFLPPCKLECSPRPRTPTLPIWALGRERTGHRWGCGQVRILALTPQLCRLNEPAPGLSALVHSGCLRPPTRTSLKRLHEVTAHFHKT